MHVPEAKRWVVTYMNMRRIISVLRCDHAVVFCKRNANKLARLNAVGLLR